MNLSQSLSYRFYSFPHYIEDTTFGISCDAFANLKETLTRHKPMVAEYLERNYDRVSIGGSIFRIFRWLITYFSSLLPTPLLFCQRIT